MNTTRIALITAIATTLGCGSSPAPDLVEHDAITGASAAPDGGQEWNAMRSDAGPVDGGPADEISPKPSAKADEPEILTFDELRDGPARSGTVRVRAYFKGIEGPQRCHEEEDCSWPVALTHLSPVKSGGRQTIVDVQGHPAEWRKLDRYAEYTFMLELSEGYRESLAAGDRELKLKLVGCDDCPRTRETTLEALAEEPEQPGYAQVQAYLVSSNKPSPCPPKSKCQPAASTTIITSQLDGEDAISVCAHGLIHKAKKLIRKGEPLTFVLRIDEGYKWNIGTGSMICGDPRDFPISIFECLDCTP